MRPNRYKFSIVEIAITHICISVRVNFFISESVRMYARNEMVYNPVNCVKEFTVYILKFGIRLLWHFGTRTHTHTQRFGSMTYFGLTVVHLRGIENESTNMRCFGEFPHSMQYSYAPYHT